MAVLLGAGLHEREVAAMVGASQQTVSRDRALLREQFMARHKGDLQNPRKVLGGLVRG